MRRGRRRRRGHTQGSEAQAACAVQRQELPYPYRPSYEKRMPFAYRWAGNGSPPFQDCQTDCGAMNLTQESKLRAESPRNEIPRAPARYSPRRSDLRCFEAKGPRPLLQVLTTLEEYNALSSPMLASLLLHFMPTIFQRAQKKIGRINKSSALLLNSIKQGENPEILAVFERVSKFLEQTAELRPFAPQLECFLSGRADSIRFGSFVLDVLRTFGLLPATTQAEIVSAIAPLIAPIWRSVLSWCASTDAQDSPKRGAISLSAITHWDSVCCGCGQRDIQGPRFHCENCDQCDMCGPCSLLRSSLHDASHTFRCLFRDVRFNSTKTAHREDLVVQTQIDHQKPVEDLSESVLESLCKNIQVLQHLLTLQAPAEATTGGSPWS